MKAKQIVSLLIAVIMAASVLLAGGAVTAEEQLYADVKPSRWSYEDIMYVTENGLMNGTTSDRFAPAETMTRAMVVTVLYRLQGEPKTDFSTKFTDVKPTAWYGAAVNWAAEEGIVNGVGDGKYAPMETITREQLATIIMRYAPFEYIIPEERADITGFADYGRIREYAREALSWANAFGLITGKTEDTLAPREGATREQFAAILRRFKECDTYTYALAYNPPVYNLNLDKEYALVTDADIYVAVDGNDGNEGSINKPIATFARAKEMVRELKKTKTEGGIVVAFKAGEYGSLDNLTFTSEDAGSEKCPITYCAYGDGDVVFSNSILLSEDKFEAISEEEKKLFDKDSSDKIYKISLEGQLDELKTQNYVFSETSVCHEARYPNKQGDGTDKYYTDFTTRVEEEGKREDEYDKLLLQGVVAKIADGFTTYDGLKITGMFRTGWLHDTFVVKEYDRDTNILTLDFAKSSFENGYPISGHNSFPLAFEDRMDDTIFFHNLAELLDAPGEYWFDVNTKNLYFYEPSGDYSIGVNGTYITIGDDADHLTFKGLDFVGSTDVATYCYADNVTFDSCRYINIAGISAIILEGVVDSLITDCEFSNFVGNGVHLRNWSKNLVKPMINGNNVITNNYFHDFTLPQYFSAGLSVQGDCGTYIANNVFKDGGHVGMDYTDCILIILEYNVFDNMMADTIDSGAVGTWNSICMVGNEIRYNLFCNIRAKGGMYGIYLDDNTGGQKVYGNIFYNAGDHAVTLNNGRDNELHDNIIINSGHIGNFLMTNPGLYPYLADGTPELYTSSTWWDYYNRQLVTEDSEYYDLWRSKWPLLYSYHADPSKLGEIECLFTTVNHVKRNVMIGSKENFGEIYDMFCVKEDNKEIELTENPYFADPTHGDYTIICGADDFDVVIDFGKMGIN